MNSERKVKMLATQVKKLKAHIADRDRVFAREIGYLKNSLSYFEEELVPRLGERYATHIKICHTASLQQWEAAKAFMYTDSADFEACRFLHKMIGYCKQGWVVTLTRRQAEWAVALLKASEGKKDAQEEELPRSQRDA